MKCLLMILVVLVSFMPASSSPPSRDWSSCEYELDRVQRAARDASYAASDVQSKADELESCVDYPDTYDLLGDGCRSYRSEYESAVSNLESELGTLNRRLRSVQYSCGYQFSLAGLTSTGSTDICAVLKRYRGQATDAQLMTVCKTQMSEAKCRKCLGSK